MRMWLLFQSISEEVSAALLITGQTPTHNPRQRIDSSGSLFLRFHSTVSGSYHLGPYSVSFHAEF